MNRIIALVLPFVMSLSASALTDGQVMCAGGTVRGLGVNTVGRLDIASDTSLTFEPAGSRLTIPHSAIEAFVYSKEVTRHLGVLPAIGIGLIKGPTDLQGLHEVWARELSMPLRQTSRAWLVTPRKVSQASKAIAATPDNVPCMRTLDVVLSMLAGLILVSDALAQAGDWRAVENLAPGTRISVNLRFHMLCDFRRATDARLVCEPVRRPILIGPREITFDRKAIREVHLEYSDDANTAIGAAAGARVGAGLGAALGNSSLRSGGGALLLGGAGAIIGGFAGQNFPIVHGKVIYKRLPPPRVLAAFTLGR
jgi:uncharacterized protein YcfJ